MAVQDALIHASGSNQTWFGLGGNAGLRILVLLVDRGGGQTATVQTFQEGTPYITATLIASRITDPSGSNRRSVFLFEAIVPQGIPNNQIVVSQVLDGASTAVAHSRIAMVVSEASGYNLEAIADADSGAITTLTQSTGTTSSVPLGDLLLIAGETTRGETTATWGTTTNTPTMPGSDSNWNLSVTSGSGTGQRRGSVGYAHIAGATAQTWQDAVTYGTSVLSSALIAVWRSPAKPTANAGTNQTITAGTMVQLDGMASGGAGGPYTYQWRKVNGTQTVTFSPNATSATVTFPTQAALSDILTLGLTVTDSAGVPSPESLVTVTVNGPRNEINFNVDDEGKLEIQALGLQSWKSTNPVPTGEWAHVAFVRSGASVALYINGQNATISQSGGVADVNFGAIEHYIGSWGNGTEPFVGQIDDARVFDTALTQPQIQTWMNTPVGGIPPATTRWHRGDGVALKPYVKTPGGLVELE